MSAMSFEQAHQRLQEIHTLLASGETLTLDQITQLQTEAKSCYDLCQELLIKDSETSTV